MQDKSQRFWNTLSSRTSREPEELSGTSLQTVEATLHHLSPTDAVLDYGCGTGDLTAAVAARVKTVRAIDTASGMIEAAREKAQQRRVENIRFEHASIDGLDAPDGSFQAVTAFNVLHYVDDVQMVSRRICDLLVPGGLFISSTACMGERVSLLGTLVRFATKLGLVPDITYYKEPELEALIASGGFRIVEAKELSMLPDYFIVAKKI